MVVIYSVTRGKSKGQYYGLFCQIREALWLREEMLGYDAKSCQFESGLGVLYTVPTIQWASNPLATRLLETFTFFY